VITGAVRVLAFAHDESQNLVNFGLPSWQSGHFGVHDLRASSATADAEFHNRIAVNARDALD
jgi:hypothetical protein